MIARIGVSLLAFLATTAVAADPNSNYDAALKCSQQLKSGVKLAPEAHKACLIAISTTYVDAEEDTLAPDKLLVADDVGNRIWRVSAQ